MSSTALSPSISPRRAYLAGLLLAVVGAIFFSAKAIVAKLMYRYHVDAVMVISLRMMFALPMFAVLAVWQARNSPPLAARDYAKIVFLGLIGYYLSSFLDFLGLQYISAGPGAADPVPDAVLRIADFLHLRAEAPQVGLVEWCAHWLVSYLRHLRWCSCSMTSIRGGNNVAATVGSAAGAGFGRSVLCVVPDLFRRTGASRVGAHAPGGLRHVRVQSVACIIQFFVLRPASAMLVQPVEVYQLSLDQCECSARCCRCA
jgi:hypothetical protein